MAASLRASLLPRRRIAKLGKCPRFQRIRGSSRRAAGCLLRRGKEGRRAHEETFFQRRRNFEHQGSVAEVVDPPDPVTPAFFGCDVDLPSGEPESGALVAARGLDLQEPLLAVGLEGPDIVTETVAVQVGDPSDIVSKVIASSPP